MAQEIKRCCGYRRVGGMYLCGDYIPVSCDRLPYRLECCPVCSAGIKPSRGFIKINPLKLMGAHDELVPVFQDNPAIAGEVIKVNCFDKYRPCYVCDPTEDVAFIMTVGEKHYPTPDSFLAEGVIQGISKRIAFIPKELELGKTVIYLAHPKACEVAVKPESELVAMAVEGDRLVSDSLQPRFLEAEKMERCFGLFSAFVPQRIEKLIWKSDATGEEMEKLKKRGITPIIIDDNDPDHK